MIKPGYRLSSPVEETFDPETNALRAECQRLGLSPTLWPKRIPSVNLPPEEIRVDELQASLNEHGRMARNRAPKSAEKIDKVLQLFAAHPSRKTFTTCVNMLAEIRFDDWISG